MRDASAGGPGVSRLGTWFWGLSRPLVVIVAVGIVARLLLMSASMVYDLDYWAVVIRNIEAGDGLYGAEGYYYTPVWGYFLSLSSLFQSAFLSLGEVAVRVVEAFPVEFIDGTYYTATAPSLAFIYSVKIPLMLFDLALAYLVMVLARELTDDRRKAVWAFTLTFLSPVLMCSSGVIGMPDTIAAVFAVLCIILVRRGMPFLAGMMFALAVLTKFFPVFLIFMLVAYLFRRSGGDVCAGARQVAVAALGSLAVCLVVFAPQLAAGNVEQCFQFLTDRTATIVEGTLADNVVSALRVVTYGLVLFGSAYVGYKIYRGDADPDEALLKGCLLVATLCLVYPPTTQYMVILVPFLALWAAAREPKYMLSWKIVAVGAVVYVFASNALTLMPVAVWTSLISVDTVMAVFEWFDTTCLGGIPLRSVQFLVGGVLQCIGVMSVLLLMYGGRLKRLWGERG